MVTQDDLTKSGKLYDNYWAELVANIFYLSTGPDGHFCDLWIAVLFHTLVTLY